MEVVLGPVEEQRFCLQVTEDTAPRGEEFGFKFRVERGLAVAGAEERVDQQMSVGMCYSCRPPRRAGARREEARSRRGDRSALPAANVSQRLDD